jgi:membrane associated rhomboid family serine protease
MTPWVTRLMIANVIVYLLSMASPQIVTALAFVPALVLQRPWTLLTYMFLHGGFFHIAFNMLGLYFFGPRLELELGGRDFLLLYGISGLSGALFSFVIPYVAVIGASAAVFGVFIGFARYWPREMIYIWGVIPVQARWLVVGMAVLSLLGGAGFGDAGIAHFAHLGGFAGGYLFLVLRDRNTRTARFHEQLKLPPVRPGDLERWRRIDPASLHEVNRGELQRILEKLERQGIASLTETEREFLDRFSRL